MKGWSIKLKSTVEFLSAGAVLLGLAFVGFELRQNTAAVEASSRQSATDAAVDWIMTIAADPDLARIWGTAAEDLHSLNDTERKQLHLLSRSQWLRFQNAFMQRQGGTLSAIDWEMYRGFICRTQAQGRNNNRAAGLRVAMWDDHKGILLSEFVEFVETCRGERIIQSN